MPSLRDYGIIAQTLQGKQQQAQQQKMELLKLLLPKMIEQSNPLNQLLTYGKVGEALQNMGLSMGDLGINPQNVMGGQRTQGLGPGMGQGPRLGLGMGPGGGQGVQINRTNLSVNGQPQGPSNLRATEYKQTPFGGIQPTKYEDLSVEAEKKQVGEAAKLASEQTKSFLKSQENVRRLTASAQELVANAKQAVQEMGGFGAKQYYGAKIKQLAAKSGFFDIPLEEQFSGLSGFEAQLKDMTLAMSPILTNQNRIIRGIINMLRESLPKFPTSEAEFNAKLRQTIKNSFRIAIGISKGMISPEEIRRLETDGTDEEIQKSLLKLQGSTITSQEEAIVNNLWNKISSTPASKPGTILSEQERSQYLGNKKQSSYKVLRRVR